MSLENLLKRLKTANAFYEAESSEQNRGRILEAMEDSFQAIAGYGIEIDYSFGVLIVLYGEKFAQAEFGMSVDELFENMIGSLQ